MPIQSWFVCKDKECRGFFRNVDLFIEHKKEKHFLEFQSTICFVFDEREEQFLVVPQNPASEDENGTSNSSFQFLVSIEEPHDESRPQIDSLATNTEVETEPIERADEFQPESILPHPYVTGTSPPRRSLRTNFERNKNNINDHNYYDAGTEPSAFVDHQHGDCDDRIASPSRSPSVDAFVDADFNYQLNSQDTAKNTGHNFDVHVTDTDTDTDAEETGNPAGCNSSDEEDLEIIPKAEVIVFENEYDSQWSDTEIIIDMHDDANNDGTIIKSLNNPFVLLKRLTAKEIQSASDYRKIQSIKQIQVNQQQEKQNSFDLAMEQKLLSRVTILSPKHNYPKAAPLKSEFQFKCNLCCAKKCKSVRCLKLHLNSCLYSQAENKNRHGYCAKCNKLLKNSKLLQGHCERVHKMSKREFFIKTFRCQLCAKEFKTIENLSLHTRDHVKNEIVVKRRRCKSTYSSAPSKERPFLCYGARCGRAYPTKRSLKTHLRLSKCGDPFVCNHLNCGQSFKEEKSFQIHQLSHSQKPKPPSFTCGKCGVSFKERDSLLEHLKNHSKEIPFKCSYPNCEKSFQKAASLSQHSDSHFGGFRRFPEELVLDELLPGPAEHVGLIW